MKYKIYISVTTDKGAYRNKNEDNFLVDNLCMQLSEESKSLKSEHLLPGLFAVCDGMGGLSFGKEASYLAINLLINNYPYLNNLSADKVQIELNNLILKVNQEVFRMQEQRRTSGCTLALVYLHKDNIFVANVGDSKVYQYRKRRLIQLSMDHNQAQERRSSGLLQDRSNSKNVLTQYLGMSPKEIVIEPYFRIMDYDNLMFLLCSDGLTEALSEKEIEKELRTHRRANLEKTTDDLVELAIRKGAKDNVTAMLIKIKRVNEVR